MIYDIYCDQNYLYKIYLFKQKLSMSQTNPDNMTLHNLHKNHGTARLQKARLRHELASFARIEDISNNHPQHAPTVPVEPKRLIPEEITRGLRTKIVGSSVITYEQTTSTMDIAKRITRTDFIDGTVIFAEEQTRGKGRSGHSWYCPRYAGLLFTLLLKHNMPPDHLCLLTGTMAVSITETIRETLQVPAEIKWPNDITIKGKKVGGVLVELDKGLKKQPTFLVGIGLNVNTTENELPKQTRLPATSLAIEKKGFIDRILLAKAILQDIDKWLSTLKDEHFGYITERWKDLCITIGKNLTIRECGVDYAGKIIDVSHNGGLMMKLDNGQIKIFRGEHATIVP